MNELMKAATAMSEYRAGNRLRVHEEVYAYWMLEQRKAASSGDMLKACVCYKSAILALLRYQLYKCNIDVSLLDEDETKLWSTWRTMYPSMFEGESHPLVWCCQNTGEFYSNMENIHNEIINIGPDIDWMPGDRIPNAETINNHYYKEVLDAGYNILYDVMRKVDINIPEMFCDIVSDKPGQIIGSRWNYFLNK